MSNPNPYEDTEFNDALRKHGILPPLPKPARTPSPPPSPTLVQKLVNKTEDEIDELLLEADDSETERMIIAFREQRLKDLKKEQRRGRFGTVIPISREDYNREVTEASKVNDWDEDEESPDDLKGTGVVCFLYKEGNHVPSVRLAEQMRTLAARYLRTKFTSIVGDKCIPNYPDRMLPTLILYRNGEIKEQLVAWGVKQEGTLEEIEAVLIQDKILVAPKIPIQWRVQQPDSDDDGEDEEDIRLGGSGKRIRNIRHSAKKGDESDSDFDL